MFFIALWYAWIVFENWRCRTRQTAIAAVGGTVMNQHTTVAGVVVVFALNLDVVDLLAAT